LVSAIAPGPGRSTTKAAQEFRGLRWLRISRCAISEEQKSFASCKAGNRNQKGAASTIWADRSCGQF